MHLATYLGLLHSSLNTLADAFRQVGQGHGEEPDVWHTCRVLAGRVERQAEALAPVVRRYGESREDEPERLHATGLDSTRTGAVGLLRDLQDLYAPAALSAITWTVVGRPGRPRMESDRRYAPFPVSRCPRTGAGRSREGNAFMADLAYALLLIGVFALLAMTVRGLEKL
jgi:hypothetical protein